MPKIRVLIADDHGLVRSGLRLVLSAQADMEVVGEAVDGPETLAKTAALAPDVLTLDFKMPGISGVKLIERLRREAPQTQVVVLTMYDDTAFLRAVLGAGGSGYVVKKASEEELLAAIRSVHQGQIYIGTGLTDSREDTPPPGGSGDLLTPRELEVLRGLAGGETNKEIAGRLHLSVKTIDTHRARLMEKLGLHSRAELVRYAFGTGLLGQEERGPK
jgi:two-component system response regulator NreC